ncbi:hypothetical protein BDN72DRAFT_676471 [Pluteus cervinus]|uniref:Uncharacterized protein n=1 Tax=Pluteus cervinus TaxID=181527 RepID=A0ACD3ARC6_9AGAR|nr:hypothetical protein BDN72DRAFT_676471 [Pluteus cervinus]
MSGFIFYSSSRLRAMAGKRRTTTILKTNSSSEVEVCPQCARKYNPPMDVILLNPSEELMWVATEKKWLEAKRSKKRESGSGSSTQMTGTLLSKGGLLGHWNLTNRRTIKGESKLKANAKSQP